MNDKIMQAGQLIFQLIYNRCFQIENRTASFTDKMIVRMIIGFKPVESAPAVNFFY